MVAANDTPVRWGILGAANIAVKKVAPAMQRGTRCQIVAMMSAGSTNRSSNSQSWRARPKKPVTWLSTPKSLA